MNTLVWFRNDLRIEDNPVLERALSDGFLLGVYFFDPRQFEKDAFGFRRTEKFRAKFLIETVKNLKKNLQKLNITLLVFNENPESRLYNLVKEHNIQTIYCQMEWTRDENTVLAKVKQSLDPSTKFIESAGQFLYHPEDIPFDSFQGIPDVFTQFRKNCEKQGNVQKPCSEISAFSKENLIENKTRIPSLKELGLDDFEIDKRTAFPFKGGEDEAIKRLDYYIWESQKITTYKKTRNQLVGTDYSSKLSAWLSNGSISSRTIFWAVQKFEKEVKRNESTYWLIFELIWRDYFKYISIKYGNKIFAKSGILNKKHEWKNEDAHKQKWIEANTKEPFVNANMKELILTGWMSNRGRQNVASYWSKHLGQDWRIGAAYFESMLIDYDVHSNWGNWMYVSGVGNDPRNRKFNIKRQAELYDPKGEYQATWLKSTFS